jgi:hypothetical protein
MQAGRSCSFVFISMHTVQTECFPYYSAQQSIIDVNCECECSRHYDIRIQYDPKPIVFSHVEWNSHAEGAGD